MKLPRLDLSNGLEFAFVSSRLDLTFLDATSDLVSLLWLLTLPVLMPDEWHVTVGPKDETLRRLVLVGTLKTLDDEDLITLSSGSSLWPLFLVSVQ